jgi:hypothetical protein
MFGLMYSVDKEEFNCQMVNLDQNIKHLKYWASRAACVKAPSTLDYYMLVKNWPQWHGDKHL